MNGDDRPNMCSMHPFYDGAQKPDGGCARCLAQWIAKHTERYARAEFAIADAIDATPSKAPAAGMPDVTPTPTA